MRDFGVIKWYLEKYPSQTYKVFDETSKHRDIRALEFIAVNFITPLRRIELFLKYFDKGNIIVCEVLAKFFDITDYFYEIEIIITDNPKFFFHQYVFLKIAGIEEEKLTKLTTKLFMDCKISLADFLKTNII